MYVAIVGKSTVEPREVIKQFSNAIGAVHVGVDVASYFIGSELSVMQHKSVTAASRSTAPGLLVHSFPTAEPYRS